MTKEVLYRLEASRKELLDLGLRNPLINYRKRAKQVNVVDELTREIYRLLVTDGREMSFKALPEVKLKQIAEIEVEPTKNTTAIDWGDLLSQPGEEIVEGKTAARHTDTKLQTSLSSEKLQTRLLSIHNNARTYLEEQGVNILYLALGFLHWYESPSASEPRRAPLILVPVELTRSSAQERFRIAYSGEEIGDNLSLIEKLRTEFGLELPEMGDSDDLDIEKYFAAVANTIKGDERWKVKPNEITMGFFSFGKFLMYKDLDITGWSDDENPKKHHILSALLVDGFREPESTYGDDSHIDEIVSPNEIYQVADADSSQIVAILDANAGRNFVLQGPPGTGKSQTITNIIAECIGRGRKVLFVSEKMAALEVVKRRLDKLGLGDVALELHSHKTNKKKVLEELNRTLHQGRPQVKDTKSDIDTLTQMRDRLNAYCDAVNRPIGNTSISFIMALGQALQAADNSQNKAVFDFSHMTEWSESEYRAARMQIEVLDRHLAEAGPPAQNPFRITRLTEFLPSQRTELENALATAKKLTDDLIVNSETLAESMNLQIPEKRREVELICRAARRAMEAPHLEGLELTSGQWQARRDDIAALIKAGRRLKHLHAKFDNWLVDGAWNQNLLEVRQHYITIGKKWWRFLSGKFRKARARLQGLCRRPLPKDTDKCIVLIDAVSYSQKHHRVFDELSPLGKTLFGAQWKNEASDWDVLEQLSKWVVTLYGDVGDGVIPEGIINFLSGSPKIDPIEKRVQTVEFSLQQHAEAVAFIAQLLKLNIPEQIKGDWNLAMKAQGEWLGRWYNHLDQLNSMVRYNQIASEMNQKGLGFVLPVTKDWGKGSGSLTRAFDFSWYNGLVEKAYAEIQSIKMFDRGDHEYIVKEFSRLDRLLFQYNQTRLALVHWEKLPNLNSGGEMQIIAREVNKKRRHMPIRKLIAQVGQAIQAIKPVFMMSPMSIATYIPPATLDFDLVVFDEASQVKPVDAFGAILRGKQTLVVGDSKQLPPTNFFETLIDSEDEDDFEYIGDMESILSLFLAKGAPERMLRWHYRSRHDSLIAVSNNEFYHNRLVVFPSPGINPIARGLRLIHVAESAYDRGKTRTNPIEAKAVAQAVMKHAKDHPDLSLGVAAFSVAQRDAIELQLELLRRFDHSCELFFSNDTDEPFFIKNLENVQGDERDVIMISIGYGKTAEGYFAMSFGPLNRDGGERRLNVLISRAKLAMDVFSNFKASDMDLNRSNARGVLALRNFLAYAESRVIEQPISTGKEPDSPFEEAVIEKLVQYGIKVEPQVGTAGFFIDIAVKDPEKPGRYILGIECDGATYHSSRSARDRDRLRQEVLEGLGWRLYRIWSTDWYRNPQKEMERVLAAIQQAKEYFQHVKSGFHEKEREPKGVNPGIHRDDNSRQEILQEQKALRYEIVKLSIHLFGQELHELPPSSMLEYVQQVVNKESPVHTIEVIRRITEGTGLKRAGSRIHEAINDAIGHGTRQQVLVKRQDFLWRPDMSIPPVRDRSHFENTAKKFEWVSPEEIRQALLRQIERSFSINASEAISSAAKLMGFHRVNSQAQIVFEQQISALMAEGHLLENDGVLSTAKVKTDG